MRRMYALVEGQTELEFVSGMLTPHLRKSHNAELTPIVLATSRAFSGTLARGGGITFARFKKQIRNLLLDQSATTITMMLDYYGLRLSFPRGNPGPSSTPRIKAEAAEKAIESAIGDPRFKAYLALHEFEAMLYVSPDDVAQITDSPKSAAAMRADMTGFATPEDINDDPRMAPSKRLLRHIPGYQKTLHGPLALMDIGLGRIRQACPHFAAWLSYLENTV